MLTVKEENPTRFFFFQFTLKQLVTTEGTVRYLKSLLYTYLKKTKKLCYYVVMELYLLFTVIYLE